MCFVKYISYNLVLGRWTSVKKGIYLARYSTNLILTGWLSYKEEVLLGGEIYLVDFYTKTISYGISGCYLFVKFRILCLHLILGK